MVATLAETDIIPHSNWFAVRWTRFEVKNVWLLLSADRVVVFTLKRQKRHSKTVADKAEIIFGGCVQCARSKSNKFHARFSSFATNNFVECFISW